MPIFEYSCTACDHRFELLIQNAADKKGVKCPHCSSSKVDKQFSSFGVAMGGSSGSPAPKCPPQAGTGPCMPHGCGCH